LQDYIRKANVTSLKQTKEMTMKIQSDLYIRDTLAFAKGSKDCFALSVLDMRGVTGWVYCGAVQFDVNFDESKGAENAISAIDEEVEKTKLAFTEKMAYLEQTKQELLCIGSDS